MGAIIGESSESSSISANNSNVTTATEAAGTTETESKSLTDEILKKVKDIKVGAADKSATAALLKATAEKKVLKSDAASKKDSSTETTSTTEIKAISDIEDILKENLKGETAVEKIKKK